MQHYSHNVCIWNHDYKITKQVKNIYKVPLSIEITRTIAIVDLASSGFSI